MMKFKRYFALLLAAACLSLAACGGEQEEYIAGDDWRTTGVVVADGTITHDGESVDVLVTDYGIAVNPQRPDLIECLDAAGIPHVPIEALQKKAYSLVGTPDDLEWEDQVVAVLEARDGTILDVVRKIKPLKL